jgi:cytochrome c oxidase subunit 1
MNRRIAVYDPKFQALNELCTIGAIIMDTSIIPFTINVFWSIFRGEKAGGNPWRALTLEWQTTSPPAIENFEGVPVLATGPYDYGMGDRDFNVYVPFSEEREPALAAGPNSALRADPDPAVAANPEDRQGESQNRE